MRYFVYLILIFLNFILQTTTLRNIEIFGVIPNTMIILIVSFSFMRGQIEGAFIGAISGLLVDIFFSNVIGLNTFIGLLTGYLSGHFYNEFYKNNWLTPFVLVLTFSIFYESLFYLMSVFLRGYPNIFWFLTYIILPEALYTSIVSIILYKILYYVNILLEKTDKEKIRFYY